MVQPKSRKSILKKITRWLVASLVLTPILWFFYIEAGRTLSYIAIRQIAKITNTNIRTGSIEFQTDGSVFIEQLVINPKKGNGHDTILKAKRVYARFDPGSLLLLRPRLKVMDIDNFVFNAQYDLDTGWSNLSGLKINYNKNNSGRMPRISLKEGTLQYSKISNGQSQVAVSVPIDADFGLDKDSEDGYRFEITTATMSSGFAKSRLEGLWKPGIVTINGGISSIDVPELEMAWIIDVLAAEFRYDKNNDFSLKLSVPDLESRRNEALDNLASVGPIFLGKSGLFTALQGFFDMYQPQGMVDAELEMSGNLSRLSESTMAGNANCKDAAFCYNKFPYAIERLTGRIDFTKNNVTLNNLSCWHGDTQLFLNGSCSDFGPNLKYGIRITSDNMPLDNDLYTVLKPRQKEFWSAFSPTGFAAIDFQLIRQTQTDKEMKLTVELHGTEAVYRNFPYQLQNLTGRLLFNKNKVIFSDVVSLVSQRKITLNGEIETRGDDKPAMYDFLIEVNNVPLDATLETALTEKQKNLYEQFCPAGLADGVINVSTQDSGHPTVIAGLSFKNTSLKLEQFPLPVSDITAKAIFTPELINFKEFAGRYGNDLISLTGQIHLDQEYRPPLYQLAIKLEETLLNDDLFNLLPGSLRKIISELKPEGRVNLSADLNKESLTEPPDYSITLECLHDSVTIPKFPYPLKDITGTLTITDNSIKLRDITAITDGNVPMDSNFPEIKLNGEIILAGDTYSNVLLQLSANGFIFDDRFGLALPKHVQPLYDKLSPEGRFDLDFENIHLFHTDDGQKSIDFAGTVNLNNNSFKMSGITTELNTALKINGMYTTGEGLSSFQGAFNGGTLKIHGKSFTNLKAHIFYDPDSRNWSTQDLIADFYGGKLKGKFEFKQPAEQAEEYVLQTGFENVDLKQFLSDTTSGQAPEKGHTSGIMDGSLSLNASLGDNSSRIGTCRLSISDMQVGKLSPLAKVLQVLQLSGPEDYAFERMYVDSYIKRNNLFVRKLDLSGQSIAFYGSGSMDLQNRNINMALTSRGKRLATDDPSILQSLTEGLGQAMVRMDVTGDLYDPKVTTTTLPLIEQTLNIFGSKPDTQN
ncbi:MAG: AsmA-like C-terminal domain-containing protein [Sedimentisphaerales bacterium]